MSDDTKSPASESEERKTTPQTGELDVEKLDEATGGVGGSAGGIPRGGSPPAPTP